MEPYSHPHDGKPCENMASLVQLDARRVPQFRRGISVTSLRGQIMGIDEDDDVFSSALYNESLRLDDLQSTSPVLVPRFPEPSSRAPSPLSDPAWALKITVREKVNRKLMAYKTTEVLADAHSRAQACNRVIEPAPGLRMPVQGQRNAGNRGEDEPAGVYRSFIAGDHAAQSSLYPDIGKTVHPRRLVSKRSKLKTENKAHLSSASTTDLSRDEIQSVTASSSGLVITPKPFKDNETAGSSNENIESGSPVTSPMQLRTGKAVSTSDEHMQTRILAADDDTLEESSGENSKCFAGSEITSEHRELSRKSSGPGFKSTWEPLTPTQPTVVSRRHVKIPTNDELSQLPASRVHHLSPSCVERLRKRPRSDRLPISSPDGATPSIRTSDDTLAGSGCFERPSVASPSASSRRSCRLSSPVNESNHNRDERAHFPYIETGTSASTATENENDLTADLRSPLAKQATDALESTSASPRRSVGDIILSRQELGRHETASGCNRHQDKQPRTSTATSAVPLVQWRDFAYPEGSLLGGSSPSTLHIPGGGKKTTSLQMQLVQPPGMSTTGASQTCTVSDGVAPGPATRRFADSGIVTYTVPGGSGAHWPTPPPNRSEEGVCSAWSDSDASEMTRRHLGRLCTCSAM